MNIPALYKVVNVLMNKHCLDKISLFNGWAGDALLLYEIYALTKDSMILDCCLEKVKTIEENIEQCDSLDFCEGLAGVLFMFAYLENELVLEPDIGFYDDFDVYFDNYLETLFRNNNYDLLYGIIGIGIYYLELIERYPLKKTILDRILDYLLKMSINEGENRYWKYTLEKRNDLKNRDVVNVGMLHGMPSILNFFLICINKQYVNEEIKKEIIEVINSFDKYSLGNANNYSFPNYLFMGNKIITADLIRSRIGYCYGDLPISNMYYLSSCVLKNKYYKIYAGEIINKCYKRIFCNEEYDDICFCHGHSSAYYFLCKFIQNFDLSLEIVNEMNEYKDYIEKYIISNIDYNKSGILNGYNGIILNLMLQYRKNFLEKILLLDII